MFQQEIGSTVNRVGVENLPLLRNKGQHGGGNGIHAGREDGRMVGGSIFTGNQFVFDDFGVGVVRDVNKRVRGFSPSSPGR